MSENETAASEGHECDTGHFDRTVCPEPCGMMHTYCDTCGKRQDTCTHEVPMAGVTLAEAERKEMYLRIASSGLSIQGCRDLRDALVPVVECFLAARQAPTVALDVEAAALAVMTLMGCRRQIGEHPHFNYCRVHPRALGHGEWVDHGDLCPWAQSLATVMVAADPRLGGGLWV